MQKHYIELHKTRETDTYMDYDLYENNQLVGLLQTIEDNTRDFIFGRQIHVVTEFQGKGIGTSVINNFIETHNKPFRFCIATNSEKAVDFWQFYLAETKYNKKNIRGDIWEIWKE